ncbi:MAG: SDR family NAD(P)-dependent oxidoreductase [Pseudomonadota bacterium]
MTDLTGKTAFVTGGASGLGLAMAKSMAARGAKLMLADVDEVKLEEAGSRLKADGYDVATCVCDVADAQSVQAAADATIQAFGAVHIVINNAGVALGGQAGQTALEDWKWIVDINLMGVVHGVETFLPLIRQNGEGGHIVNVASMAGLAASAAMGPYHATKFAVVGYTESLQQEMAGSNIGVSVLCPAWVSTDIHKSSLDRPGQTESREEAMADPAFQQIKAVVEGGISADIVGEYVADCVEANRFYIFTHPEMEQFLDLRHQMIKKDYAACAADPRFGAQPAG